MQPSCILEFDGASKGNPGQAGAGVVLRADDGTVVKNSPIFLPCSGNTCIICIQSNFYIDL